MSAGYSIGSLAELWRTDGYSSGPNNDIGATEVFISSPINLTVDTGYVMRLKFLGSGSTDKFIITMYKDVETFTVTNHLGKVFEYDNPGTEVIDTIHFGLNYGPGYYIFGFKSSGSTDTFDAFINGFLYRFDNELA